MKNEYVVSLYAEAAHAYLLADWQCVMNRRIFLQRQPDGSFIDWGRSVTVKGDRGEGPARWYIGEAAKVMALVLESGKKRKDKKA